MNRLETYLQGRVTDHNPTSYRRIEIYVEGDRFHARVGVNHGRTVERYSAATLTELLRVLGAQ